ncbi:MAG: aspartate/glutamate racemase family protein [Sediminispirochaetaceae bacterium]
MKTAGIIGGLGPDTTAEFYIETIRRARPVYSYSYPSIFIYNVPVPFAVERAMVQKGQREEEMFKVLSEAVGSLEKAGVDFVVIPCNTVHIFYDRLAGQMNVPLLNILDETAAVCSTRAWKRVGVLGTKKTVKSRMYADALEKFGIETVDLPEDEQDRLTRIIYRILAGSGGPQERSHILEMISVLGEQGADGVILGCTDLQHLVREDDADLPVPAVDSMSSLVDAVIRDLAE